jgi:dipeptidyl aminopeptidase/acylaminoacyl peptidase
VRRLAAVCCCALAAAGCGGGGSRYGHPDGFGEATWSAGGELAFVASRHDVGPTAIYVLDRRARLRRVTPLGLNAWSPAWSPDGRRLAYAAGRVARGSYKLAADDLFVVSADGRRRVRLTRTAADESSPSWSPDGRDLAYVRGTRIFVIAADGTGARRLTDGGDSEPQWSPDGRWIAYVHGALGNGSLRVVHPDGTGARRVAGPGVDCPRWSPRGGRIAFRVYGAVRVVGVRGGPALAPVSAIADGYSCDYAWSPDGRSLVVARLPADGGWQLQSVDLASFRARTLVTLAYDELGPDLEPAWAPGAVIAVGGDELRRVDPSTGSVSLVRAKIGG